MGDIQVCDLCGEESSDCTSRLMFYRWFVMLFGYKMIEMEVVCPRCRKIERIKTAIGLGLLGLIFVTALAMTVFVLVWGP